MNETARVDPANPWGTFVDVKFGPLERFDASAMADANALPWWNQTLARVNDCVFRLGVFRGEYPWHRHEDEDELFFVLDGAFELDAEDRDPTRLEPGQGIVVPRGVRHRPRAAERTVVVMIEGAGIVPTGD
ncbi:MAG TPA: cupin domain-containing protein [Candidatus Limnocylindrales bacterium]|nr:cupin domain-containing protein [Candidatus Limnocylindrales bacterium]